ncbi:hypothetical protein H4R35_000040 [Dimargaris xerosporica]|nr:hypothetical protein H4R35_000040 [Dimargaris xerosporica]
MQIIRLVLVTAAIIAGVVIGLPQPTPPDQIPPTPYKSVSNQAPQGVLTGEMVYEDSPETKLADIINIYTMRYMVAYISEQGVLGFLNEVNAMLAGLLFNELAPVHATAINAAIRIVTCLRTALNDRTIPLQSTQARQWAIADLQIARNIPYLLPIHHLLMNSAILFMELLNDYELNNIAQGAWQSYLNATNAQFNNKEIVRVLQQSFQQADGTISALKDDSVLQYVINLPYPDMEAREMALVELVNKAAKADAQKINDLLAKYRQRIQGDVRFQ